MKNIVLAFLCVYLNWLVSQPTLAQTGNSNYANRNTNWNQLDISRIPGRTLIRALLPDSLTPPFNGRTDSVATLSAWESLRNKMQYAGFDSLPGSEQALGLVERFAHDSTNVIPLVLLNVRYARIKEYALDSALLVQLTDSTFGDGPNHRESPYREHRLFALGPLRPGSYQGAVRFYFGPESILTNLGGPTCVYALDCGDGLGWRPLTIGMLLDVQYATTGPKRVRLRAVTGTDTLWAATSVTVLRTQTEQPGYSTPLISGQATHPDDNQPFPSCYPPRANDPLAGQRSYGKYTIRYADPVWGAAHRGHVRKPIVLIEGIDFGREINYAVGPNSYGEFGWDVMVTGLALDKNHRPAYEQLAQMPLLLDELRAAGYDVVLLDFAWGADLIQKNAMLLVNLLRRLRDDRLREDQIVVAGVSMGGLVSRYALAHMEQQGEPHCVRLWLSFDSPQNVNANVPIGLQRFVEFFNRWSDNPSAIDGHKSLEAPAAQQMLERQVQWSGDCYRQQFLNRLQTVGLPDPNGFAGFPQRLRRVAIVNGSKTATDADFTPGAQLVDYEYRRWNLPWGLKLVIGNVWADPNRPNGGPGLGQIVFDGKYPKGIAKPCFLATYPVCVSGHAFHTATDWVNVSRGYDCAPGGQSIALRDMDRWPEFPALSDLHLNLVVGHIRPLKKRTCFIPSTSALALRVPTGQDPLRWSFGLTIDSDHPASDLTPFQAFYAPVGGNELHTEITGPNGPNIGNRAFMLQQLNGLGNRLGGDPQVNITGWSPTLPYNPNWTGAPSIVQVFNFTANSYYRYLTSVAVNAQGILYVNRDGLLSDAGIGQLPSMPQPGTFRLETSDCGANVAINPGGLFELGTPGATATGGYKAEVVFNAGSVLHFNGGTLTINPYSTLVMRAGSVLIIDGPLTLSDRARVIVEPGARVEILPGCQIALNGDNAVLQLKGEIVVKPNSTLTFSGSGYLLFDLPNNYGAGNLELQAASSRIVLQGTDPEDQVAVIANNSYVKLKAWRGNDFFVENGLVTMGQDAWLDFSASKTRIVNATFRGGRVSTYDGYKTIYTWNRPNDDVIENSRFEGAQTGLTAVLDGPGSRAVQATFRMLTFTNCQRGLLTVGQGANLYDCTFDNATETTYSQQLPYNPDGWRAEAATLPSRAENSVFMHLRGSGIEYRGGIGADLTLKSILSHHNQHGVRFSGPAQLRPECGGIYQNTNTGITVSTGALMLDRGTTGVSIMSNGGYGNCQPHDLTCSAENIKLEDASDLALNDGFNDLVSANPNRAGITGQLRVAAALTSNVYTLPARHNRWNIADQAPTLTSEDVLVNVVSTQSGGNQQAVLELRDGQPLDVYRARHCYVDPCDVPVRADVYFPCNRYRALLHCADCEPITTSFVTNDSLHHAILVALSYQHKYDSTSTDLRALQMLREILLHPLADTTAAEREVLAKAYQAMQELFAASLEANVQPAAATAEIQAVIDQKLLELLKDATEIHPEFYLLMDKALAAVAAGQVTEARAILAEAAPVSTPLNRAFYDYWNCYLDLRERVTTGELTWLDLADQVGQCSQPTTAGRGQQPETPQAFLDRLRAQDEARAATRALKTALSLAPNPTAGQLTATLAAPVAGTVVLEVRTLTGQPVRRWERPATRQAAPAWTVDVADLPTGVYLFRALTPERTFTQRLVVKP